MQRKQYGCNRLHQWPTPGPALMSTSLGRCDMPPLSVVFSDSLCLFVQYPCFLPHVPLQHIGVLLVCVSHPCRTCKTLRAVKKGTCLDSQCQAGHTGAICTAMELFMCMQDV